MPTDGESLMGFAQKEIEREFQPNRAQRRAMDRVRRRQARRGQRDWERQQRNGGAA